MLHAAIDIGTNTVLLLVAEKSGNSVKPVFEEQRIPRLGKGVDASGNLDKASMEKVIRSLSHYRNIIQSKYPGVKDTAVTATSAVRDASNRTEFIQEVLHQTGFEIQVLSGQEEAERTYRGALCMVPDISKALVIDIGGGSTEIACGVGDRLLFSHSYDMGSVRFTERYLKHDPPLDKEIQFCRQKIVTLLDEQNFDLNFNDDPLQLVGVAGTVTSLAFMALGLEEYDPDAINNFRMTHSGLKEWIGRLSSQKAQKLRERYPVVMEGRAEVFIAGLLILDTFMDFYEVPDFLVSTGGIRHGSIL